jgi:hypothetical protein
MVAACTGAVRIATLATIAVAFRRKDRVRLFMRRLLR